MTMALNTPLSNYQANKRLMVLIRDDFQHMDGPHDAALHIYWLRRQRSGRGRYPGPGNSETIMRNQVLRAKSFGLEHDGRY